MKDSVELLIETCDELSEKLSDVIGRLMNALPGWEGLTDLDKGCALLHLRKCNTKGSDYATAEYPCRYLESTLLKGLSPDLASMHAQRFGDVAEELSGDEYERLYDLALEADRAR